MTPRSRRLGAFLIAFCVASGLLIQGAQPASACTCAGIISPVTALASSDGAFVGTLIDKEELGDVFNGGDMIDYTFQVEASLKGDIGETVIVKSAADGAACGFEMPIGSRNGIFLTRAGANWEGGLCSITEADLLLEATRGLPEPVAGSPPHVVVAADLGPTGLIALDSAGQTVGYGEGPVPWSLSACPDDETFVGQTADAILTWSFSDLSVLQEMAMVPIEGEWFTDVICGGPAADSVYFISVFPESTGNTLERRFGDYAETIQRGIERLIDSPDGPLAIGGDGVVYRLDTDSATLDVLSEPLGDVRGQVVSASPSPDGSHLVISTMDWSTNLPQGAVYVVDLEQGTATAIEFACDVYPIWLDNDRLFIHDSCTSDIGSIYNADLQLIGEGEAPEYAYYANRAVDEEGSVFYPGDYSIQMWDPETAATSEFASLLVYPGHILVVPEKAREAWKGPAFSPSPITDTPVVTYVEDVAEPIPVDVSQSTPVWLIVVGVLAAVGVLALLLAPPKGARSGSD